MKQLFWSLLLMGSFSLSAHSEISPEIEPGPVQNLSEDASVVSRILFSKQVQSCLEVLQNSPFDISITSITFQHIRPNWTEYQFSGVAIVGGDVAVGKVSMIVIEKEQDGPLGAPVTNYSCKTSLPPLP